MQRKPHSPKKFKGTSLNRTVFKKIADTKPLDTKKEDAVTRENIQSFLTKPPSMPKHPAKEYSTKTWKTRSIWAYDPNTRTATKMDPVTHLEVKVNGESLTKTYKSSDAITFILADREMPGAFKPAAAREHRFSEDNDKQNGNILYDFQGNAHTICPAHGGLVSVQSLQTDHAHSSSDILKKQVALVKALNENLEFSKSFINTFELHDLFVLVESKIPEQKTSKKNDKNILNKNKVKKFEYQGTLYFYERYYNDIDNLWNICQPCNLHKSDKDALNWFKQNKNFGIAFTKEMARKGIDQKGLVITVGGKGLAEFALEWYRENHKQYIITTKLLYQDVIFQIQNNLHKAAIATGAGNTMKAEGHNALASLSASLAAAITAKKFKITPPEVTPPSSPEVSVSSSEDELFNVPADQIYAASNKVRDRKSPDTKALIGNMNANLIGHIRSIQLEINPNNLDLRIANYKANIRQAEKYNELYEKHLKLAALDALYIPDDILKQIKHSAEVKEHAKKTATKITTPDPSSSGSKDEKDSFSSRKRMAEDSEIVQPLSRRGLMFGRRSQSSLKLAESLNKKRRLDKTPSVTSSQKIDTSESSSLVSQKDKSFKRRK
jgi:hypothetical protein